MKQYFVGKPAIKSTNLISWDICSSTFINTCYRRVFATIKMILSISNREHYVNNNIKDDLTIYPALGLQMLNIKKTTNSNRVHSD